MAGTVASVLPGCGGTVLQVRALPTGRPEVGSTLTFTLSPSGGLMQQIRLGTITAPVTLCSSCKLGCDLAVPLPPGGRVVVQVPFAAALCGATFGAQGSILVAPGGCNFGGLTFTASYTLAIRIGCQ